VLEPDDGKLSCPVLRGPGPAMGSGYSINNAPVGGMDSMEFESILFSKGLPQRSSAKKVLLMLIDLSLSTTKYVISAAAPSVTPRMDGHCTERAKFRRVFLGV
jgi:hypothetical protein